MIIISSDQNNLKHEGVCYEAVDDPDYIGCDGCAIKRFKLDGTAICDVSNPCTPNYRVDHRSVIWKEIKVEIIVPKVNNVNFGSWS